MSKSNYRQASKDFNWVSNNDTPNQAEINVGSLQRIADALEIMSKSWGDLIADRDYQKRRKDELVQQLEHERKRIAALRGSITRLKKRSVT